MNLDGVVEEDPIPAAVATGTKKRQTHVCSHPHCGKKGHATTMSKKCLANPEHPWHEGLVHACAQAVTDAGITLPAAASNDVAVNAAADAEMHDATPFDQASSDESALCVDTTEHAEDDEGNNDVVEAPIQDSSK